MSQGGSLTPPARACGRTSDLDQRIARAEPRNQFRAGRSPRSTPEGRQDRLLLRVGAGRASLPLARSYIPFIAAAGARRRDRAAGGSILRSDRGCRGPCSGPSDLVKSLQRPIPSGPSPSFPAWLRGTPGSARRHRGAKQPRRRGQPAARCGLPSSTASAARPCTETIRVLEGSPECRERDSAVSCSAAASGEMNASPCPHLLSHLDLEELIAEPRQRMPQCADRRFQGVPRASDATRVQQPPPRPAEYSSLVRESGAAAPPPPIDDPSLIASAGLAELKLVVHRELSLDPCADALETSSNR